MSTPNGEMPLDKVLSKVRALTERAEHHATPPLEAQLCRRRADALMLKYAVTRAMADSKLPPTAQSKPMIVEIALGDYSDILGYIGRLAGDLARHSRCRIRNYTAWHDGQWHSKVYGFEHDLRYFEVLYTTTRLHMVSAMIPRFEPGKSLEENVYEIHNAGYNWLEIAEIDGWRKLPQAMHPEVKVPYKHEDGRIQPATMVGSRYKRACIRAARVRGETRLSIPAGRSKIYRKSAAQGYTSRINRRLIDLERARPTSAAVVLASSAHSLEDFFKEHNPDLFEVAPDTEATPKRGRPRVFKPGPFDESAYYRGVAYANTADLSPNSKMGHPAAKPIEGGK